MLSCNTSATSRKKLKINYTAWQNFWLTLKQNTINKSKHTSMECNEVLPWAGHSTCLNKALLRVDTPCLPDRHKVQCNQLSSSCLQKKKQTIMLLLLADIKLLRQSTLSWWPSIEENEATKNLSFLWGISKQIESNFEGLTNMRSIGLHSRPPFPVWSPMLDKLDVVESLDESEHFVESGWHSGHKHTPPSLSK